MNPYIYLLNGAPVTNPSSGSWVVASLTVSGNETVGGNLQVNGTGTFGDYLTVDTTSGAAYRVKKSNNTSGAQSWSSYLDSSGNWIFQCANDNFVGGNTAFSFTRSGTTPTGMTLAGNLTVSGTGNNSVAGDFTIGAGSSSIFTGRIVGSGGNSFLALGTATGNVPAINGYLSGFTGTTNLTLQNYGGNLLVGTTTDSSNGKLQLATHTTSAGGIGFGTDTSLYRGAAGKLSLYNSSQPTFELVDATKSYGRMETAGGSFYISSADASASLVLRSGNATTALTLDSSQRTILSGALRLNNAYTASVIVPTGYVTIQDSTGTTYKVAVSL